MIEELTLEEERKLRRQNLTISLYLIYTILVLSEFLPIYQHLSKEMHDIIALQTYLPLSTMYAIALSYSVHGIFSWKRFLILGLLLYTPIQVIEKLMIGEFAANPIFIVGLIFVNIWLIWYRFLPFRQLIKQLFKGLFFGCICGAFVKFITLIV